MNFVEKDVEIADVLKILNSYNSFLILIEKN